MVAQKYPTKKRIERHSSPLHNTCGWAFACFSCVVVFFLRLLLLLLRFPSRRRAPLRQHRSAFVRARSCAYDDDGVDDDG